MPWERERERWQWPFPQAGVVERSQQPALAQDAVAPRLVEVADRLRQPAGRADRGHPVRGGAGGEDLGHRWRQVAGFTLKLDRFNAVPEPAAWGLMLAGFALAGQAMRRKRTALSIA